MSRATTREDLRAALKKVRAQLPDQPEAFLIFAVFEQAALDHFTPRRETKQCDRDSAERYLRSEMPHLAMAGINPEWVRRVFRRVGCPMPEHGDRDAA